MNNNFTDWFTRMKHLAEAHSLGHLLNDPEDSRELFNRGLDPSEALVCLCEEGRAGK